VAWRAWERNNGGGRKGSGGGGGGDARDEVAAGPREDERRLPVSAEIRTSELSFSNKIAVAKPLGKANIMVVNFNDKHGPARA